VTLVVGRVDVLAVPARWEVDLGADTGGAGDAAGELVVAGRGA